MELLNVEQMAFSTCICEILTLRPRLLKCEGLLSKDLIVEWDTSERIIKLCLDWAITNIIIVFRCTALHFTMSLTEIRTIVSGKVQ